MNDAACAVMKSLVQDRADDLMKFILSAEAFVHPDSTDFDDLKRKLRVFPALSRRTLIPFKIKDNIVHCKNSLVIVFSYAGHSAENACSEARTVTVYGTVELMAMYMKMRRFVILFMK
jgi:hypothetical protein